MEQEIEAKVQVDSFKTLRERLRALGAQALGTRLETNIFFDTPDRALLLCDSGLRIRQFVDPATNARRCEVTYKGPAQAAQVKIREEIEAIVLGAGDAMQRILLRLGFVQTLHFEKRRESWQLDTCRVELDELPLLGRYIEVEGPSETDVLEHLRLLNLHTLPKIRQSYAALLDVALRERGNSGRVVAFTPE
jgi:adenylate cyclase, class 2